MRRPEQTLQIAVAKLLQHALRPPTIWTAFPAGGGGRVRGAFLKAMGLKAGWPDLLILHRFEESGELLVIGIELKADKGRQTPEQKKVMEGFKAIGAHYRVCRSVDDVNWALMDLGLPMFARITQSRRAA